MIQHTFISIKDWHASAQWPFVVKHGVEYGGAEWVRMCAWLEDHVGEVKQSVKRIEDILLKSG